MTDLMSRIEAAVDALVRANAACVRDSIEEPGSAYDWGYSDARAALLALVAEVVKDAERYRWLRDTPAEWAEMIVEYEGDGFDRAIDLAMNEVDTKEGLWNIK